MRDASIDAVSTAQNGPNGRPGSWRGKAETKQLLTSSLPKSVQTASLAVYPERTSVVSPVLVSGLSTRLLNANAESKNKTTIDVSDAPRCEPVRASPGGRLLNRGRSSGDSVRTQYISFRQVYTNRPLFDQPIVAHVGLCFSDGPCIASLGEPLEASAQVETKRQVTLVCPGEVVLASPKEWHLLEQSRFIGDPVLQV